MVDGNMLKLSELLSLLLYYYLQLEVTENTAANLSLFDSKLQWTDGFIRTRYMLRAYDVPQKSTTYEPLPSQDPFYTPKTLFIYKFWPTSLPRNKVDS